MKKEIENKINSLYILDGETNFLSSALDKKKNKIIISNAEFNDILNSTFQIKNIIILVELDWDNSISELNGYEIAKELMNSPNRISNFNLLFISTLKRETIFKSYKSKNRIFVQKFKHIPITTTFNLSEIVVPQLSERKFDYLKNYCLLESGILDRLEHDIRNLLSSQDPQKLKKVIEDINANRDILTNDILKKTEELSSKKTNEIKNVLTEIHRLLQLLQNQINNPGESTGKKSHSVVMLIEDEATTLDKLKKQFGQYFHTVKTFPRGTDAHEELKINAKKYDVVITDMELLDGNFDDEILGIDILELCEKEYPFIVTRVITSLPKNALKRLIGKGLNEIIFKSITSESVIPPFENLVEFVQQIDNEVKKRKVLRSMAGPKHSWWGKFLTKELYIKQIQNPEEFTSIWNNAKNKATSFLNGDLDNVPNQEKIGTELKQVNETVNNPQSGWEIIELLLSHRLIAIGFAAKYNWDEFYYTGDGLDAYVNQNGFQKGMESKPSKAYFNTFLGLSVTGTSDKREERLECKVNPKDFFPEEIKWLTDRQPDILMQLLLSDIDENLHESFSDFMTIYKNSPISKKIMIEDTLILLDNFIEEYPKEISNKDRHAKLKFTFDWNLYDAYDQAPQEMQVRLNTMKEQIFYT